MKSLLQFINEASSMNVMTFINSLNVDFSETAGMSIKTKQGRAKKAKAQEKILVDAINEATDQYTAMGIEDYCKSIGKSYTYEMDSKMGDVVIMKDENPVLFIDLKVAETKDFLGTPTMLSLVNFASTNDDKKYYLCSNINGSNIKLVNANKLYNKVVSKKAIVIVSKDRSTVSPEVQKLNGKVKLIAPNNNQNADTSTLYDEDFVATSAI